ncbi:unnamed protein product [Urochloa humidicola]
MAISQSEWPPSPLVLSVFSSMTRRWEERSFVREGEAAGTVADMDDPYLPRHSVCCRGALYVQRENHFVFRISLSDDTYRVIKPPKEIEALRGGGPVHLGRSHKEFPMHSLTANATFGFGSLMTRRAVEWTGY